MWIRSPFLQTGFTKGHRSTRLFSFLLFQCGPDYEGSFPWYYNTWSREKLASSVHTDTLPMLSYMFRAQYSLLSPELGPETDLLLFKTDLGLFASCSGWTLSAGHPRKACFKAELKSGTKNSLLGPSLPTIWTYFTYIRLYMYIHIGTDVYIITHSILLHSVNSFFLKHVWSCETFEQWSSFQMTLQNCSSTQIANNHNYGSWIIV